MILTITVNEQDITSGLESQSGTVAVDHALNRLFPVPECDWECQKTQVLLHYHNGFTVKALLPKRAQAFIRQFNDAEAARPTPITFKINTTMPHGWRP